MAANIAEMARMWFRMLCSLAMKRADSPARKAIQFTARGIVPPVGGEHRGNSRATLHIQSQIIPLVKELVEVKSVWCRGTATGDIRWPSSIRAFGSSR